MKDFLKDTEIDVRCVFRCEGAVVLPPIEELAQLQGGLELTHDPEYVYGAVSMWDRGELPTTWASKDGEQWRDAIGYMINGKNMTAKEVMLALSEVLRRAATEGFLREEGDE